MKLYKRIFIFFITAILSINFFMCYTIPVFASEGVYDPDTSWWDKFLTESSAYLSYLACRVGAITQDHDFAKWVQAREDYIEWWNTGHISRKQDSNGNVNYTFDKELMAYIKQCLDEYIKTEMTKEENGGFIIFPTTSISDVPADRFKNAQQFRTFRNIIVEKGCLAVQVKYEREIMFVDPFSDPDHPIMLVGVTSDLNRYENYSYMPVTTKFFCGSDWNIHGYCVKVFPENNVIYTSVSDAVDYINPSTQKTLYQNEAFVNWSFEKHGSMGEYFTLYSVTGENVRVYVSELAAKNYSVGNRKIYFTENYYNYVPEDLEVSIDDLQKSVDDLQKIIDELLKRIKDDTSEKEIMDLLRQILDALKNQQGTGGGGSGGGDVVVDIDLTETNGWLSKIYTKLSQVFDKISSISIPSMRDVVTAIEDLSQMLKRYLSEITGDLDDIKGQLEEMSEQELNDKTDSFLSQLMDLFSEISEVAKGKFPFSLPSDMQFLIARISGISPETAASYSYGADTVSALSLHFDDSLNSVSENDGTDHGGSGSSRPGDDPDPPGGGGSSRPGGSGFVSVEHGGGGSGREPVSSNNWAPVFTLPIVIERYGIEEYIVLDMSVFDPVSKMSRTLFLIMYIVCLYNMTFKVIGLWGDLVG